MRDCWKMPDRLFWRRYRVFASALAFIAVAVLIFLECGFGSDSLTVLLDGLHRSLGISVALASAIYNVFVLAVAALYARRYIGLGSVLYSFHMVLFLAICERLMPLLKIANQSVPLRAFIFALGQVMLSLGVALLILANFGMNSLDAILHQLSDQFSVPYVWFRTASDLLFVLLGYWLGGAVGVGTIVSVLLTGYLIVFISHRLKKHMKVFLQEGN